MGSRFFDYIIWVFEYCLGVNFISMEGLTPATTQTWRSVRGFTQISCPHTIKLSDFVPRIWKDVRIRKIVRHGFQTDWCGWSAKPQTSLLLGRCGLHAVTEYVCSFSPRIKDRGIELP